MRDLAGFRLMRAEGDGSLADLAELPVTDQERFQKVRRFAYIDTSAQMGHSYRYTMIAETTDGYQSDPSNVVEQTRTQAGAAAQRRRTSSCRCPRRCRACRRRRRRHKPPNRTRDAGRFIDSARL